MSRNTASLDLSSSVARRLLTLLWIAMGAETFFLGGTHAAEIREADPSSLDAVLEASAPGDEIRLAPGNYVLGPGTVFDGLRVTGSGSETTRLSGSLELRGDSTLSGASTGYVISRGATITESKLDRMICLGDTILRQCRIERIPPNLPLGFPGTPSPGVIIEEGATGVLENCEITGHLGNEGSGLLVHGTLEMDGCVVSGNTGAALTTVEPWWSPTGTVLSFNVSPAIGGGIALIGGTAVIRNSVIEQNRVLGGHGAGIYASGANLELEGTIVRENVATSVKDWICQVGTYPPEEPCLATDPVAVWLPVHGRTVMVEPRSFELHARGGGIHAISTTLNLDGCVVSGNAVETVHPGTEQGSGAGIWSDESITLDHSTVALNVGDGLWILGDDERERTLTLRSSIVARNRLGGLDERVTIDASHSCWEGPEPLAGNGNTNEAPLFCGWETDETSSTETETETLIALGRGRGYRLSLSPDSRCLGTGENGSNMGAPLEACDEAGPVLRIRLAEGIYPVGPFNALDMSLEGAGVDLTRIDGALGQLRSGQSLSDLEIVGGLGGPRSPFPEEAGPPASVDPAFQFALSIPPNASPTIRRCRISHGSEWTIRCESGSAPTFSDCVITDGEGPVLLVDSNARFENCELNDLDRESKTVSDAIRVEGGAPSFNDCEIVDNRWSGIGAFNGASITLTGCRISRHRYYGATVHEGEIRLRSCRIEANLRGGLSNSSSLLAESCLIVGNGNHGVWSRQAEKLDLTGCVITGNSAGRATNASTALAATSTSEVTLLHCTIAGNRAPGLSGEGAHTVALSKLGSVTITNSIILSDFDRALYYDTLPVVSHSYIHWPDRFPGLGNLVEAPTFISVGAFAFNRYDADGLPDFIVEEPDLRLAPGSPGIDAGLSTGHPERDIDGAPRNHGGLVDIGAYESLDDCDGDGRSDALQIGESPELDCDGNGRLDTCDIDDGLVEDRDGNGVPDVCHEGFFLRGDSNADGIIDVTDPVSNLAFQFLGSFRPPCLDACDYDDSGFLDLTDPVANFLNQFLGGVPPALPGKEICGPDPTPDELRCEGFLGCEARD